MTDPQTIFMKLYDQAKVIADEEARRKKEQDSKLESSDHREILENELFKKINYESVISELAARLETLPEFSTLQSEILSQGLDAESDESFRGARFVIREQRNFDSLQQVFERVGFYHDLLSGVEASAIWSRIHAALNDKPIEVTTLLRLLGCDFPHEFDFLNYSIVRISAMRRLHYGPRGQALFGSLHPESVTEASSDGPWYLTKTEVVDTAAAAYSYNLPHSRDKILDAFWLPLFVLALCHSGAFNISEVSLSIPGWDMKTVTLLDPLADDQPWSVYLKPSEQMEESPEWSDECYGVREAEWALFEEFREMVVSALKKAVRPESWGSESLYRTSRWYLRGRLADHPELTVDERGDVLLYYVTCLENLLMTPGEKDAITEKLKIRIAWLVGRNDQERAAVSKAVAKIYDARSKTVHRAPKSKKGVNGEEVDFLGLRDICRRAIASSILVLGGKWEGNLDAFLKALPISRTAQGLAEQAARTTGSLTRCY